MTLQLTSFEYQKVVCFCKSKTAFQKWTGIQDAKKFAEFWDEHQLKTPTDLVRSLSYEHLVIAIGDAGSYESAAIMLGVSPSFLKQQRFLKQGTDTMMVGAFERTVKRYGSVDLAAFMTRRTPAEIRQGLKEEGVDPRLLIQYDQTSHHNAKGRRAELWWARQRGSNVTKDMNLEAGSQAPYDFEDLELGRVNVKSSSEFRYTAQSRRDNSAYWKISVAGLEDCDTVACVFMNRTGSEMQGHLNLPAKDLLAHGTKTVCFINEAGKWRVSKMPEVSKAD